MAGEEKKKHSIALGGFSEALSAARVSSHRLELGGGAAYDARLNSTLLTISAAVTFWPKYDSLDESEMVRSARGQKQLLAPLAALTSHYYCQVENAASWLRQACETTQWQGEPVSDICVMYVKATILKRYTSSTSSTKLSCAVPSLL